MSHKILNICDVLLSRLEEKIENFVEDVVKTTADAQLKNTIVGKCGKENQLKLGIFPEDSLHNTFIENKTKLRGGGENRTLQLWKNDETALEILRKISIIAKNVSHNINEEDEVDSVNLALNEIEAMKLTDADMDVLYGFCLSKRSANVKKED
jgi:hypothetical protein